MNLLVLAIFAVLLAGAKLDPRLEQDCFQRENTQALKGICAVAIVLHHLSFAVDSGGTLLVLFRFLGNFCVGYFFLISGFGCSLRCFRNAAAPDAGYLVNRGLKILIPAVTAVLSAIVLHLALNLSNGGLRSTVDLIRSQTLLPNSWYIFAQCAFYVLFWIAAQAGVRNRKRFGGTMLAGSALCALLMCRRFPLILRNWLSFPAGVLVAANAECIGRLKGRKAAGLMAAACLLCGMSLLLAKCTGGVLESVCYSVSTACFGFVVLLSGKLFRVCRTAGAKLGEISYELYLIHGVLIAVFADYSELERYPVVFALAVMAGSVLLAVLLHGCNRAVLKRMDR